MRKYLIERELPGAGSLNAEDLAGVAAKSNEVLAGMPGRAQWLQSFVADDRIVCLYLAEDPEAIREHARCGGFPVTAIHEVVDVIDPTTADRQTVPR